MMDELMQRVGGWSAKLERELIDTTVELIAELMQAWIKLVVDSATSARQAPLWTIIADGASVGWRRWGKPEGSSARMATRVESFRAVVRTARLEQLRRLAQ